jgi:uncharacterized protein
MNDVPVVVDVKDRVREIEAAWIPMKDGRRLAARLWLPADADANPAPVILEYIPYRRHDGTRARDNEHHAWNAAHGFAAARVDIAGSGDSDGLVEDEYVKREQDDAIEIIAWLAAQPWSNGNVGMIGISWGGFNGLQVAARRPPALKAVISLCSTVDRYNDDVHFMGGCHLADNLDWGTAFFTYASLPPDPDCFGPGWKDTWLKRLEATEPFPALWLQHQRRDAFWKHGSVCEDYAAIQCPVLAVSGWADGYTAAVFRLVENLKVPCKGIVGPWGHKYPFQGVPGPAIGFLQECARWWNRWLKGVDTGVEKDPALRLWLQDSAPPRAHHDHRPGRWLAFERWPDTRIAARTWHLGDAGLASAAANAAAPRSICSPLTVGKAAGEWCAYGLGKIAPELPLDQRVDDLGSLVFDSPPLEAPLAVVGTPKVTLRLSSDQPQALVCVRLSDVLPSGEVARVSYGLLNLAQRESQASPSPLVPGTSYTVTVGLTELAHLFPAGHRVRVAISTSYWPMVVPSPRRATVTLDTGRCSVDLPVLADPAKVPGAAFARVEHAPPLVRTALREGHETREMVYDIGNDRTTFHISRDDGDNRIDEIGTVVSFTKDKTLTIQGDDPLSGHWQVEGSVHYRRGDWDARTETSIAISADEATYRIVARLRALDHGKVIFERDFDRQVPRDNT